MGTERHRDWFLTLWLVAAAALAGCGEKWETTEFPEAGFTATFPMPVMSQPKDGGILRHWAHVGDVQLQVVRSPVPEGATLSTGAEEILRNLYQEIRSGGNAREESPPRMGQFQGRYPTIEFHLSGNTSDGKDRNTKGRMILVGDHIFIATALWRSGDKKGPLHADRFLDSFKITQ